MDPRRRECIIWGGYAGGNVGDELNLAVAIEDMKARFGDSVAVLTRDPDYTGWLFPEVEVVPYVVPRGARRARHVMSRIYRAREAGSTGGMRAILGAARDALSDGEDVMRWRRAVEGAQQLYLSGGGYLTDLFDLGYLTAPIEFARRSGVSIASAPIGIGPFVSDRAAGRVARLLAGGSVMVRDRASLAYCRDHGIDATLAADDGFRVREVVDGLGRMNPGTRVGVCSFDQPGGITGDVAIRWWEQLLRALRLASPGAGLEGFCFHNYPDQDLRSSVRLFSASGLDPAAVSPPTLDFRAAVASLTRYDLIISARFHSIVIAIVLGLPYVAVASGEYYGNKMESLVRADERGGGRLARVASDDPQEIARWAADAISGSRDEPASSRFTA